MSDFWAGYLWGRGSGDGPSLPPEIALLFGGLLVFVGVLYLLRDVFNAIAGVTQAHPVLSLLVVGVAAVGIGELVAVNEDLDVEEKVSGMGALVLVLFGVFWVIGVLSGASSLDNASWPVQAVMMVLSLVIVCGFLYMLVSLLRYRWPRNQTDAVSTVEISRRRCHG
ncbi:hypothetical protein [Halarchaeum nitratireducens]|uniref:Uncharacterized protein n=1 Tax=Halarchaeum nitratireducens TaxID=489913 RepID=A0A830GCE5_9EURY|nr:MULTISPECIES: hypothetical protein [Halarchaeum]MBP2250949.1 multisubunit Na+/H+ antiporter MnhG subunit [Halarchaeum solikamskense]GGN20144.1 hypothetical protein GCM10009021_21570 [Halarchaeum nitratireducens]